jgi:hypothetical protein
VELRRAEELSDGALQRLIEAGQRESELIDELAEAVRSGDKVRAWKISITLAGVQEQTQVND